MSHSLAKLRELFGDPLLVAVPRARGLALTSRAAHLLETLPSALEQLNEAIATPEPFEPLECKQVFRIATVDYFEIVMLPYLMRHLAEHAPKVSLEIQRTSPAALASLAAGDVDLALVATTQPVSLAGLRRTTYYRDPFAVLARKDHPAIGRRLDLETYLSLSHVAVKIEGNREGAIETSLAKLGKTRHVALCVPHFFSAPLAVSCTDYIATMVSTIAARARELPRATRAEGTLRDPSVGSDRAVAPSPRRRSEPTVVSRPVPCGPGWSAPCAQVRPSPARG